MCLHFDLLPLRITEATLTCVTNRIHVFIIVTSNGPVATTAPAIAIDVALSIVTIVVIIVVFYLDISVEVRAGNLSGRVYSKFWLCFTVNDTSAVVAG